jgi:hypothetical protein
MERKSPKPRCLHRKVLSGIAFRSVALAVVFAAAWHTQAQDAKSPYPKMAPLDQYMMDRPAEIALARSAAPESISRDADILVMGPHGYETAVKGKNGFVCIVERGWTAGIDEPDFWNPRVRAPICFNPPGAQVNIPVTLKKTELVIAGQSATQMAAAIKTAFDKKEFPALEPGGMCYMLSKQGYLNDHDGHWHPHLMFFLPPGTNPAAWGAGSPGSPVFGFEDTLDRFTLFLIPVTKWSDGTAAMAEH